ncbi:MAG: hypothetical protein ACE5DN_01405 [Flavobacteriales bacterium]
MLRRFLIFGFGILLGCALVYYLFEKKRNAGLSGWLPSNFIKTELLHKLKTDSISMCRISCISLDSAGMKRFIQEADILFGESAPRDDPKRYVLKGKNTENDCVEIEFSLSRGAAHILSAEHCDSGSDCLCK